MAEIHIEKKGTNWLAWIIGLIVLALLIWWLVSLFDNEEANEAAGVAEAPAAAVVTPVTDLTMITTADPMSRVGQEVRLASVPVENVVSDKAFWLGSGANSRVFAVLENEPATPGTATEGRYNVQAGQTISAWGTVERMPASLEQQATPWNLQSTDLEALRTQQVYVLIDSLRIAGQ